MNPIRIAVDAMGGDNGHKVVVRGAIKAAKANPVKIILVGNEKKLANALRKHKYDGDAIEIYNATEEKPRKTTASQYFTLLAQMSALLIVLVIAMHFIASNA